MAWAPRLLGMASAMSLLALPAAAQARSTPPRLPADSGAPARQSRKVLLNVSPQRSQVFLTWSEQPGNSYEVRWRSERDTAWLSRAVNGSNYADISPLVDGVRYQFQVTATGGSSELSSDIVSTVPRYRDDCQSTRNVFCSVRDLRNYAIKANLDLRLLRCRRIDVRTLDENSPNCRYSVNQDRMTLNRAFGGLFQPPERLPDAASVRDALRRVVWGSDDPLLRPGSLVSSWQDVNPPTLSKVDLDDILKHSGIPADSITREPLVRSLVMRVHGNMLSRLTWFSVPGSIPGRYAIYNEGHGEPGISAVPMIEWLLRSGWQVLVLDMLLEGLNTPDARYPVFDHDDMEFAAQQEGVSALRWFFLPIVAAVDLVGDDARKRGTDVDLIMLGRSGGAWQTMLYSSMDPRVDVAVNISGGAPLSTFLDSTVFRPLGSHYENETATLYDQVSETDFLLAAGTKGNFHFYSTHDPCCYTFTPAHPWIRFLGSLQSRKDKKYRVFVDEKNDIHGLGTHGLVTLGKFLEEVGLPSKKVALTAAQLAKLESDSLAARRRPTPAKSVNDSSSRKPQR